MHTRKSDAPSCTHIVREIVLTSLHTWNCGDCRASFNIVKINSILKTVELIVPSKRDKLCLKLEWV